LLIARSKFNDLRLPGLLIALAILILQTVWLLPALDTRALAHIRGELVQPSNLHLFFISLEGIKVVMLAWFGLSLFQHNQHSRLLY